MLHTAVGRREVQLHQGARAGPIRHWRLAPQLRRAEVVRHHARPPKPAQRVHARSVQEALAAHRQHRAAQHRAGRYAQRLHRRGVVRVEHAVRAVALRVERHLHRLRTLDAAARGRRLAPEHRVAHERSLYHRASAATVLAAVPARETAGEARAMHRQLRAATRWPRHRHDVRDAHQRIVLELDAACRELLRVQRHLHRHVGRTVRRRHAVQRIALGEVRAVRHILLPAEAAAVLRAATEAAARHRHVGATGHRPALKVEARHHRLGVVREVAALITELLSVVTNIQIRNVFCEGRS